jgi:hypothetical protein
MLIWAKQTGLSEVCILTTTLYHSGIQYISRLPILAKQAPSNLGLRYFRLDKLCLNAHLKTQTANRKLWSSGRVLDSRLEGRGPVQC